MHVNMFLPNFPATSSFHHTFSLITRYFTFIIFSFLLWSNENTFVVASQPAICPTFFHLSNKKKKNTLFPLAFSLSYDFFFSVPLPIS